MITSIAHAKRVSFVGVVLLLSSLAGCGGGDDEGDKPVAGTFVGKAAGTNAFVAVAASPASEGQDRRAVTAFVCDGRRLCEWFTGSATGNSFTADSDDGDAKAQAELSEKAATGTIDLPGDRTVRFEAGPAAATAGLYELTVTSKGRIRGASEAGVGLTGTSTVPNPGEGRLKLADGKRVKFVVTSDSAGDGPRVRAGQLRVIVMTGGELRGAGKSRRTAAGDGSSFFIRSSSK